MTSKNTSWCNHISMKLYMGTSNRPVQNRHNPSYCLIWDGSQTISEATEVDMLHVKCQSSTDPFQLATLKMASLYVLYIYRRPTKNQRSCWSKVQLLWTISKSTMLLHFMDPFQWNWTTPVKLWISDTKVKWLQLVEFFFIDTEPFPTAELKYYHPTLYWQKTIQAWNLQPLLPIPYTSSIPSPYWMTLFWLCMYSV